MIEPIEPLTRVIFSKLTIFLPNRYNSATYYLAIKMKY